MDFKSRVLELLDKPSKANLFLLNKVMQIAVPFNKPHDFKVVTATRNSVTTIGKYKRSNFNHIKGIHAAALVTIGEFSAGTLLLKHFGMNKYRMIMKNLSAEYHYQAKMDVFSTATLTDEAKTNLDNELSEHGSGLITLDSIIKNREDRHVATIKTTWQLKDWSKTSVKV
jgi:hypothetical protein